MMEITGEHVQTVGSVIAAFGIAMAGIAFIGLFLYAVWDAFQRGDIPDIGMSLIMSGAIMTGVGVGIHEWGKE